jgi:hypothetical protein
MKRSAVLVALVFMAALVLEAAPALAQRRSGRSSGGRAHASRSYGGARYYGGGFYRGAPRSYYGGRYYAPARFYRPYYYFRPRVSLGFGLSIGYPFAYRYSYYDPYYYYPSYPYPYAYTYPYPYASVAPASPAPYYSAPATASPYYSTAPPRPLPNSASVQPGVAPPPSDPAQSGPSQANTGGLSFEITPSDARLFVDGREIGNVGQFTPTSQPLGLPAGRHRIEIRASGYRTMTTDIDVVAGQVIPFQGVMER